MYNLLIFNTDQYFFYTMKANTQSGWVTFIVQSTTGCLIINMVIMQIHFLRNLVVTQLVLHVPALQLPVSGKP